MTVARSLVRRPNPSVFIVSLYPGPAIRIVSLCAAAYLHRSPKRSPGVSMLDLLMLAIGFGLFILTIGYAVACDRL